MEDRLRRLMDFGLQGVEAYYSQLTEELSRELLELAGLMNPFREGTVAKVMDGVKEAIAELESKLG